MFKQKNRHKQGMEMLVDISPRHKQTTDAALSSSPSLQQGQTVEHDQMCGPVMNEVAASEVPMPEAGGRQLPMPEMGVVEPPAVEVEATRARATELEAFEIIRNTSTQFKK